MARRASETTLRATKSGASPSILKASWSCKGIEQNLERLCPLSTCYGRDKPLIESGDGHNAGPTEFSEFQRDSFWRLRA
jgi:hypothetical protein